MRRAEVAELADALRSGRSGHTLVWVQIPPSAYDPLHGYRRGFLLLSTVVSPYLSSGFDGRLHRQVELATYLQLSGQVCCQQLTNPLCEWEKSQHI